MSLKFYEGIVQQWYYNFYVGGLILQTVSKLYVEQFANGIKLGLLTYM